jgi:small subunit ribosomal protein S6
VKSYEGIFITKSSLTDEASQKELSLIGEEISKNGGNIENTEKWGKRSLAYPINKNKDGVYYKLDFKIETEKIAELKKAYKMNDNIIRVMIVKKSD